MKSFVMYKIWMEVGCIYSGLGCIYSGWGDQWSKEFLWQRKTGQRSIFYDSQNVTAQRLQFVISSMVENVLIKKRFKINS